MTVQALEIELNEKLMELGFLCYNRHVDSCVVVSGVDELLNRIKNDFYYLTMLRNDGAEAEMLIEQEFQLNSDITELGCVCFSVYVDGRMSDLSFVPLCEDILYISTQISNLKYEVRDEIPEQIHPLNSSNILFDDFQNPYESSQEEYGGLDINCPFGMEPIPDNYVRCSCGYRNRDIAVFCAKCGTKFRLGDS